MEKRRGNWLGSVLFVSFGRGRRQEFLFKGSKNSGGLGGCGTSHHPDKVAGSERLPQVPAQVNAGGLDLPPAAAPASSASTLLIG